MLLSGEILIRTPLSVAILPPPSLIELYKAMATLATLANQQNIDDDDIYLGMYGKKLNFYFLPKTEIQQKEELRIRNCVKQQDQNDSIPAMDREIFP